MTEITPTASANDALLLKAAMLSLQEADVKKYAADIQLARQIIERVKDSSAVPPLARLELAYQNYVTAERQATEAGGIGGNREQYEQLWEVSKTAHQAYLDCYADSRIAIADRIRFFSDKAETVELRERTGLGSERIHALATATIKSQDASDKDKFAAASVLRYLSSNGYKVQHFAKIADPIAERLLADPNLSFKDRFFVTLQSFENNKADQKLKLNVTPAAVQSYKAFEEAARNPATPIAQQAELIAYFHGQANSKREIDRMIEQRRQHMQRIESLTSAYAGKEHDLARIAELETLKNSDDTKEAWREKFEVLIQRNVGLCQEELLLQAIFGRDRAGQGAVEAPAQEINHEDLFTIAEAANDIRLRNLENGAAITQKLFTLSKDASAEPLIRLKAMELCRDIPAADIVQFCRSCIAEKGLEGEDWWKSRVMRYPALASAIMTSDKLAHIRESLGKGEKVEGEKQLFADSLNITVPLLDRLQGAKEIPNTEISIVEALPMLSQLAEIDINRVPFYTKDEKAFASLIKAIPYCQALEQFGVAPVDALKKMTDTPPGIAANMENMRIAPTAFADEIKDFISSFRRAVIIPETMAQARSVRIRKGFIPALLDQVEAMPLFNIVFDKAGASPAKIKDTLAKWQRHVPHINSRLFEVGYSERWPVITNHYTGKNDRTKGYVVIPMSSAHDIAELAKPENQDNCITGHIHNVRKGKLHICAIKDPDGNIVATAGFTTSYNALGQISDIRYFQNYAKSNTAASEEAKAVFNEYLTHLKAPEQSYLLQDYVRRRAEYQREMNKPRNLHRLINAHFDFNWENKEKRDEAYNLYKDFLRNERPARSKEFLEQTGLQEPIGRMIDDYKRKQSHTGRAGGS